VIAALAGDLALVPWARPWRPASGRAAGDWRNALGPVPLEELRVRHEALFDRTGVKGPRRLAVAAAGVKLEEA
jgi:hypothetical protein